MDKKENRCVYPGKYLTRADREALQRQRRNSKRKRCRKYMTLMVLLLWDGVLLYMIIKCLIDAVFGAVFVAVISVTMGYYLK